MTIDECREGIDRIDDRVLELLNERARLAQRIGQEKKSSNQPVFVPEREQAVLERLKALNQGPLTAEAVETIYKAIIKEIRDMQSVERAED